MNMDGTASIARTTMRIMIVKTPTGNSNRSSTRHLSWGMVGSVVVEAEETASVVETKERAGVDAEVVSGAAFVSVAEVAWKANGTTGVSVVTTEGALMVDAEVEEKAKEETVVKTEMAFVVETEETSLAEAGEKASEVDTEDE